MMKFMLVAVIAIILALSAYSGDRFAIAGPCNPQQQQC
jgi:hypothetical protein